MLQRAINLSVKKTGHDYAGLNPREALDRLHDLVVY